MKRPVIVKVKNIVTTTTNASCTCCQGTNP